MVDMGGRPNPQHVNREECQDALLSMPGASNMIVGLDGRAPPLSLMRFPLALIHPNKAICKMETIMRGSQCRVLAVLGLQQSLELQRYNMETIMQGSGCDGMLTIHGGPREKANASVWPCAQSGALQGRDVIYCKGFQSGCIRQLHDGNVDVSSDGKGFPSN
ncbi:hypothetical protein SUGI_0830440 [Cryptomeria japonica]|nr:hypothetical protein SUGI_0830440 [Cryptomeria japonica]